jgi:hypothetical protein
MTTPGRRPDLAKTNLFPADILNYIIFWEQIRIVPDMVRNAVVHVADS